MTVEEIKLMGKCNSDDSETKAQAELALAKFHLTSCMIASTPEQLAEVVKGYAIAADQVRELGKEGMRIMFGIYEVKSGEFLSDDEISKLGLFCRPNGEVYVVLLDSLVKTQSYGVISKPAPLESATYLEISDMASRIEKRLKEIHDIGVNICSGDGMYTTPLFEHMKKTDEERERLEMQLGGLKSKLGEYSRLVIDGDKEVKDDNIGDK